MEQSEGVRKSNLAKMTKDLKEMKKTTELKLLESEKAKRNC